MPAPTFRDVCRRYPAADGSAAISVRLDQASGDSEAGRVLQYLGSFGLRVTNLNELFEAISRLDEEEELSAFRCREGVAVSHASDGWWILFR